MAKAGASIGGIIGLILSLILVSFPTGTETLDDMPDINMDKELNETIEEWGYWFVISIIFIAFCGLVGGLLEEAIKSLK